MSTGNARVRVGLKRAVVVWIAVLLAVGGRFGADASSPEVVISGGASITDVGEFGIALTKSSNGSCSGDLSYGDIELDSIGADSGVIPIEIAICVSYQDTRVDRDAFSVQISISDFELQEIPEFEGSEAAHFQIPNRYLTLTDVGDISGGAVGDGTGEIAADSGDESSNFAGSSALRIAAAAAGSGFLDAEQEITLTLAVPAGVYPGDYLATITIEVIPVL